MSGRHILALAAMLFSFSSTSRALSGKNFERVIYVIFENTDFNDALSQDFMGMLAKDGALFTNLTALVHPSQANYIALTSGSLNGVKGDGVQNVDARNVVDLLEQKGLTWKVYAEDWPGNCYKKASKGNYYRKHNPFISYLNVQNNADRCALIVNADQFAVDAKNGALPNYVFYIPNAKNDGHDTGAKYADHWYKQKFGPYVNDSNFMANTILVTTFDEDGGSQHNQIYTTVYGPTVKAGAYDSSLNTYGLLRLVEDNWDLGTLTNEDAGATPIPNIWR